MPSNTTISYSWKCGFVDGYIEKCPMKGMKTFVLGHMKYDYNNTKYDG
jgi:hypothetical protein